MRKITSCILALLGLASVLAAGPGPDADTITNLPNCTLDVPAYSGYLNVSDTKALHYIFMGSKNLTSDPVVLWFNGGPGCSSLEGMF